MRSVRFHGRGSLDGTFSPSEPAPGCFVGLSLAGPVAIRLVGHGGGFYWNTLKLPRSCVADVRGAGQCWSRDAAESRASLVSS